MTKEQRDKWVEALRSGKYKQTSGFLREGECFCALGVLCDVMGVEWVPCEEIGKLENLPVYMANGKDAHTVPDDVCDMLDLGCLTHDDIVSMNDSGKSFDEIADLIEDGIPVGEMLP